jgi:transketolase
MVERFDCRDAFVSALEAAAEADPRVVVLISDSVSTVKIASFLRRFPDRYINVGIAEQDLVGVAAGLANGGYVPFVCAASVFIAGRAFEQVRVDVAYSGYGVKLCGMNQGFGYGPFGATHHAVEDVAWLRSIPDLPLVVPADPLETEQAIRYAAGIPGPIYLRVTRTPTPSVHPPDYRFRLGRAVRLRDGDDVSLIACGVAVADALEAADALAREGIGARVINMSTIEPIDRDEIVEAARATGAIVTAEEHSVIGGLGGAVAEVVVQTVPAVIEMVGVPGVFAPTGSSQWIRDLYGINAQGIEKAARRAIKRRDLRANHRPSQLG